MSGFFATSADAAFAALGITRASRHHGRDFHERSTVGTTPALTALQRGKRLYLLGGTIDQARAWANPYEPNDHRYDFFLSGYLTEQADDRRNAREAASRSRNNG